MEKFGSKAIYAPTSRQLSKFLFTHAIFKKILNFYERYRSPLIVSTDWIFQPKHAENQYGTTSLHLIPYQNHASPPLPPTITRWAASWKHSKSHPFSIHPNFWAAVYKPSTVCIHGNNITKYSDTAHLCVYILKYSISNLVVYAKIKKTHMSRCVKYTIQLFFMLIFEQLYRNYTIYVYICSICLHTNLIGLKLALKYSLNRK